MKLLTKKIRYDTIKLIRGGMKMDKDLREEMKEEYKQYRKRQREERKAHLKVKKIMKLGEKLMKGKLVFLCKMEQLENLNQVGIQLDQKNIYEIEQPENLNQVVVATENE